MIRGGLLLLIIVFILPYLIGRTVLIWIRLFSGKTGRYSVYAGIRPSSFLDLAEGILVGTLLQWAVFEVLAVPLILKEQSFSILVKLHMGVLPAIFAAGILTVLCTRKKEGRPKDPVLQKTGNRNIWTAVLLLILAVLVGWQCWQYVIGAHIDWDDSRYVAHAVETWTHGTMLTVNPANGDYAGLNYWEGSKDAVAPWPVYMAYLGRVSGIHPTILAHTLLPPVFLLLMYGVYWMLGKYLFRGHTNKSLLFTVFIAWSMLFYGAVTRGMGDFILVRLWQGKSVLAAVGIPMLFLIFFKMVQDGRQMAWLLPVLTAGCCLLSSMSVAMISIPVAALGVYYLIRTKEKRALVPLLVSAVPIVLTGYTYLRLTGKI